jgi:hypothetical protein
MVTEPSVKEEIQMAKLLVMKGDITEEERKARNDAQRKSTYMDLTEAIKILSRRGVLFIFENDLRKVLSDYQERHPGVSRPAKSNSQATEKSEHNAAAKAGY